ncbi:MAG: hypothetical protein IJG07_10530 [Prevotella sp.]|nr:hypothetical protein [Prevotella sp.]
MLELEKIRKMPVGTCNFHMSTLSKIERFREGREELKRKYPDLTMAQVRAYLRGEGDLPDDNCRHMFYAREQAKKYKLKIPERYLTGESLDVFFAPECYRFYDFRIFSYFSWYEPWEETVLLTGPLFSIDADAQDGETGGEV